MIIVLNGPIGIGKSTLGEALAESIVGCVMLDGDKLIAVNPAQKNELEYLHSTLALLIEHHRRHGYRHFILDYIWRSKEELAELIRHVEHLDDDIRCFLLTLPLEENLRRIEQRASVRAIDELDLERQTLTEERGVLEASFDDNLGTPFDVSASPQQLVERILKDLSPFRNG